MDLTKFKCKIMKKYLYKYYKHVKQLTFLKTGIPFLIHGKRNNFTKPKSSPDTRVLVGNEVSVALMSLVSVYFSQIPFTSVPRTPVHVDQLIALISSLLVTRLPAAMQNAKLEVCLVLPRYVYGIGTTWYLLDMVWCGMVLTVHDVV